MEELFTSFWAALDGRALSSLNRTGLSAAFISSLLECLVLVIKRLNSLSSTDREDGQSPLEYSKALLVPQVAKMWEEIVEGRLKVEEAVLAKSVLKTLQLLDEIDAGMLQRPFIVVNLTWYFSSRYRWLGGTLLLNRQFFPGASCFGLEGAQGAARRSQKILHLVDEV